VDEEARRSVIANARDVLAARGQSDASVEVDGRDIVVTSPTARRRAPLGELANAWHVLPPNDRDRRLRDLLSVVAPDTRRDAIGSSAGSRVIVAWAVAGTLALLALASVFWVRGEAAAFGERRRLRAEASATPAPDSSARIAQRRQAVCSGVRKRVMGGAPFGPYDTEGWVVELWLGREDGGLTPEHPELQKLVAARGIPADLDDLLAKVTGDLEVSELPPPPGATATTRPGGATISMFGGYAEPYLDPVNRARFLALADRLYDATGAQMGALWGRCGQLAFHDLGGWYRGADRGAAVGAMLFMSGRYNDGGAVPSSAHDGSTNTLLALVQRARSGIDDRGLVSAIAEVGGKVDPTKGTSTSITFPVGGYTLATRASRNLNELIDR
jgi:hypothetical protein